VAIGAKGQQRETEVYHLKPTPKTVVWGNYDANIATSMAVRFMLSPFGL
jgi:hypothetical protein